MKKTLVRSVAGLAAILFFQNFQLSGQTVSSDVSPKAVLAVMQRVADWQLAHPARERATGWVQGAGYAGMMALAGISGDPKYRDAMLAMGEGNGWQLGARMYHADDQCVGQTYAELYFLHRDPKMIAPMRERFDAILAKPSDAPSLDFALPDKKALEQWSWCDALFMAPTAWLRLYAATGDDRYLNFAVTNWWRTTDFLYDKEEHLFFRDSTFFKKQEANGKKIFWGRGNGWVMGALVRMLQYLPMNHPDRPRFEQLFKDMSAKILTCQQPDGLWRASLLDPESYPLKETSGSGFYTYALAWGVNQGLLDRATFEPAVRKAWAALIGCVDTDGKLTHVQPIGADPKKFAEDSTEPYGVGAFLLAGSEVYRLAVLSLRGAKMYSPDRLDDNNHDELASKMIRAWLDHSAPIAPLAINISNPTKLHRDCETVEVDFNRLRLFNLHTSNNIETDVTTMDGLSSRVMDSQVYVTVENGISRNKLLFQVDLAPGETRTFYVLDASALPAVPPPIVKTTARYVPERFDDFSWESDRIAHRVFGKALETWQQEPLTSSGMDVWIKRTRSLVANEMYRTGQNYDTNWVMQDDYKVGKTRGCGGIGIWDGQKLYVSKNWRTWKLITTGPIRSEFELTYDTWDAGNGRMVSETKRISIDAGSNMSRVESTFGSGDKSPLLIAVGLGERPGENVFVPDGSPEIDSWQSSTDKGLVVQNQPEGWTAYWQPQDFAKGVIGVAAVLPKGSVAAFTNDLPNLPAGKFAAPTKTLTEGQPALRSLLAIAPAEIGKPFVYYIGAGWSGSGDFPNAKAWNDYIRRFAERRDQPLQIMIGN